jgi:hypothetical protein
VHVQPRAELPPGGRPGVLGECEEPGLGRDRLLLRDRGRPRSGRREREPELLRPGACLRPAGGQRAGRLGRVGARPGGQLEDRLEELPLAPLAREERLKDGSRLERRRVDDEELFLHPDGELGPGAERMRNHRASL